VPKHILDPIVGQFHKWIKCSGPEWTVSRLKSLKQDFYSFLSGTKPSGGWVARQRNGCPKGPFGLIFNRSLRKDVLFRAINTLLMYTSLVAEKATPKQVRKAFKNIERPAAHKGLDGHFMLTELGQFRKAAYHCLRPFYRSGQNDLPFIPMSPVKSHPDWQLGITHEANLDSILFLTKQWAHFRPFIGVLKRELPTFSSMFDEVDMLWPLITAHHRIPARVETPTGTVVPDNAGGIVPMRDRPRSPAFALAAKDKNVRKLANHMADHLVSIGSLPWPFVGQFSLVQEPGYKMRHIGNIARVFQSIFTGLGDWCFDVLREIPEDCTFDQAQGQEIVQHALRSGYACRVVDLEGATDRWPLDSVIHTLQYLLIRADYPPDEMAYTHELLKLLRLTCSGLFKSSPSVYSQLEQSAHPKDYVRWTVGLPLGCYPVWPAFCIDHHRTIQGLCSVLGLRPCWAGPDGVQRLPYLVLGDDVIFFDLRLAEAYENHVQHIGVELSHSKCFTSSVVAEFAGQLITANDRIPTAKYRDLSDSNFWQLCQFLKDDVRPLLSDRQRSVFEAYRSIPEPWGLGINPEGRSLDERIKGWLELLLPYKLEEPTTLVSRERALMTRYYQSHISEHGFSYLITPPSSDQELIMALEAELLEPCALTVHLLGSWMQYLLQHWEEYSAKCESLGPKGLLYGLPPALRIFCAHRGIMDREDFLRSTIAHTKKVVRNFYVPEQVPLPYAMSTLIARERFIADTYATELLKVLEYVPRLLTFGRAPKVMLEVTTSIVEYILT
jgi:hypothetical protein